MGRSARADGSVRTRQERDVFEFEKVTTRGGDRGMTSLYNGERLAKDDPVFELLGDLDELNSWLGMVRASLPERESGTIRTVQQRLLVIGSEVATPKNDPLYREIPHLGEADLEALELAERELLDRTTIAPRFILPGDSPESALADLARTVCRRAERKMVSHIRSRGAVHLASGQVYLNRLSDFLFVLARSLAESRKEKDRGAG
jgi:cob(I)alamin adenosyltransferase